MLENIFIAIIMMTFSGLLSGLIILVTCRNDINWIKNIIDEIHERLEILEKPKRKKYVRILDKNKKYCETTN